MTWYGAVKRLRALGELLDPLPSWRVEARATRNLLVCGLHMTEAGARMQFDRLVACGQWREARITHRGRIVAHWQDPAELARAFRL
jgi:hypothetical protein